MAMIRHCWLRHYYCFSMPLMTDIAASYADIIEPLISCFSPPYDIRFRRHYAIDTPLASATDDIAAIIAILRRWPPARRHITPSWGHYACAAISYYEIHYAMPLTLRHFELRWLRHYSFRFSRHAAAFDAAAFSLLLRHWWAELSRADFQLPLITPLRHWLSMLMPLRLLSLIDIFCYFRHFSILDAFSPPLIIAADAITPLLRHADYAIDTLIRHWCHYYAITLSLIFH